MQSIKEARVDCIEFRYLIQEEMRLIRLRQSSLRGLIGNQQYWCSSGFARTYEQAKMMEEQEKLKKGLEE